MNRNRQSRVTMRITLRHLDDRILRHRLLPLRNAILEVVHMGHIANENMERAFEAVGEL